MHVDVSSDMFTMMDPLLLIVQVSTTLDLARLFPELLGTDSRLRLSRLPQRVERFDYCMLGFESSMNWVRFSSFTLIVDCCVFVFFVFSFLRVVNIVCIVYTYDCTNKLNSIEGLWNTNTMVHLIAFDIGIRSLFLALCYSNLFIFYHYVLFILYSIISLFFIIYKKMKFENGLSKVEFS